MKKRISVAILMVAALAVQTSNVSAMDYFQRGKAEFGRRAQAVRTGFGKYVGGPSMEKIQAAGDWFSSLAMGLKSAGSPQDVGAVLAEHKAGLGAIGGTIIAAIGLYLGVKARGAYVAKTAKSRAERSLEFVSTSSGSQPLITYALSMAEKRGPRFYSSEALQEALRRINQNVELNDEAREMITQRIMKLLLEWATPI